MISRSWLFVPGDSERKLEKAEGNPADALILDLEDAVTAEHKPAARERIRQVLESRGDRSRQQLWVRINELGSRLALEDLAAIVGGRPDGVCLPKVEGPGDLAQLDHHLSSLEVREGLEVGQIRVLAITGETPAALLQFSSFLEGVSPRLLAMTWGSEDLASALGAASNRDEQGRYEPPYRWARTNCLAAARAVDALPLGAVWTDYANLDGLEADCREDRRAGFLGKLAIHPAQSAVINRLFTPSVQEIERARQIVDLFAANPEAGALGLDGQMLDRPHRLAAERVLALAEQLSQRPTS